MTETGIRNIEVDENRMVGSSQQDLLDIQTLADAILALVRARINVAKARVLQIVRSKPVEVVLTAEIKSRGSAGMESIGIVRKKTRRKRS